MSGGRPSSRTVGKSGSLFDALPSGQRQVDFVFDASKIRGLEQNPDTHVTQVYARTAPPRKLAMAFASSA
jgi:hypothetical protein